MLIDADEFDGFGDFDDDDLSSLADMKDRKSSDSLSETDSSSAKIKKIKGKKGSVSKPSIKPARRLQDDATIKAITVLRAESGDHPDSRRRIHNGV